MLARLLPLILSLLLLTPAHAGSARVLTIDGTVGPASADYVVRGLERAARDGVTLVVLEIDTPGGLDTSMRAIIKSILASPVPVAGFVHPQGARAASAGTYILYASHIAAMAPATNLGAATPVAIGIGGSPADKEPTPRGKKPSTGEQQDDTPDTAAPMPAGDAMTRKQVHDATAYIRGLAELRGRNVEWAERAVREAVSLSAEQALAIRVIDVIADDVGDLLAKLDGRAVQTLEGKVTLDLEGAEVQRQAPDWRSRLLAVIGDPGIAYILLLVGLYGLYFEFANPGFVLPGVIGAISLMLGLFALNMLPVNYVGLGLILLGVAFMVAEAFLPSFGALGFGGLVAFIIGSVMLIDTDVPGYGLPWSLIVPVALASAGFVFLVASMAVRARRRPVVTGREDMLGAQGTVLADCDGEGWATVHGETWRVRCATPLKRGDRVRVTGMDGLTLQVRVIDSGGQT